MKPAARRLVGTAEAARLVGLSERRVRRWCEQDHLPAIRVGRCWAVDPADVRVLAAHPPMPGPDQLRVSVDGWWPDVAKARGWRIG